jgi:hypothetical protein
MASRVGFQNSNHVKHDQPVVIKMVAGEDIGIGAEPGYPLAPVLTTGYILYVDTADGDKVKLMTLTDGDVYCGISETAAYDDEEISVRFTGVVWLPVGGTQVNAGNLVKAQITSGQQGDIIPWVGHTDTVAGDNVDSIIGRALATGAVRSGADYNLVPVILRGF